MPSSPAMPARRSALSAACGIALVATLAGCASTAAQPAAVPAAAWRAVEHPAVTDNSAESPFERDRRAILVMVGEYQVRFAFEETAILVPAAVLFPNARVVHCVREPRDNALSIWMENFSSDQRWATDFEDLAFFRVQYERLMAHWREHLPLKMLEVRYEDTVADLEGQGRRLVGFMGVPWDPACLDFHRNERAVQTPSRWQVRQPIYSKSVERWRAYMSFLPDLALCADPERAGGRVAA